jgi:hypothetical protein
MYQQLELPLWETLKLAASLPEDADLQEIWFSLDAAMVPLDTHQQLQVAGDAITQIAQIVKERSLLTLEEIQSAMQEDGPVVPADFFDKFVRQSMHVDFAQFVEPPPSLPGRVSQTSRQNFSNDGRSVVGVVDKAALLQVVAQEPELTDEAARDRALAVAHDEDISAWKKAIAQWMQHSGSKAVSLLQLHQALRIPLIEVWLGLLLGEQEQYQWEISEEFYNEIGEIWLISRIA